MFLALALVSLGLSIILYYIINRGKRNPPPLPAPYPVIGYSHFLYTNVEDVWSRLETAMEATKKCGGVGIIKIGPYALCAVADPEVAGTILNTCFDKDYIYDFYKPWLGNGLFSGPVHIWKPNRKIIMPALNQRILDQFTGYFNSEGKRFVKILEAKCNIKEVDLHHNNALLNLRIFLQTQMGQTLDDDDTQLEEYLAALEGFHESGMERIVNPFFHVEGIFKLFGGSIQKKQAKYVETMDKLVKKVNFFTGMLFSYYALLKARWVPGIMRQSQI